jgi:DNA-directed RNA polymerase specialized sigma24 family protein
VTTEKIREQINAAHASGDMEALFSAVRRLAMKIIFDEDAAQAVATRIWERKDKYKPIGSTFSAWVEKIIYDKLSDHRGQLVQRSKYDQLSEGDDVTFREDGRTIDIVFPCKTSQLVFEMKAEGFSSAEIARATGMKVATLEVKMSRWRKKIAMPVKVSRPETGYRCRGIDRASREPESSTRAT